MLRAGYSEGPITHWGKIPVHIYTLVMAGCALGIVLGILTMTMRISALPEFMAFEPSLLWTRGHLWRVVTYPFFDWPTFFSVFGLLFIYWYGKGTEEFLGRSRTIALYGVTIIAPVLIGTLVWLVGLNGSSLGPELIYIGTVVAFACLYPGMEVIGGIPMRIIAWICVVLFCVEPLSSQDWGGLIQVLGTCAAVWGYLRWLKTGGELPEIRVAPLFKRRPKLTLLRGEGKTTASKKADLPPRYQPAPKPQAEIDAILDKIADKGIDSLSAQEKAALQKYSADMKIRQGDR